MDFSFIEYFLIMFSTSYIIFSLAIKNEIKNQFREWMDSLNWINAIVNKKRLSAEKKIQVRESLDTCHRVFTISVEEVSRYIYHTFYGVFSISSLGIFISFFIEMNISLFSPLNSIISFLYNYANPLLSILLLYLMIRGAFLLICFSKIDNSKYLEKIHRRIMDRIEYNFQNIGTDGEYITHGLQKTLLIKG